MSLPRTLFIMILPTLYTLPRSHSSKELACQCRRCGFDPWVRKICWRRKWQPAPVCLLRKSPGQRSHVGYSPWHHKKYDMTEQLNMTYIGIHTLQRVGSREKIMDFPGESHGKESACNARDPDSIPGLGKSPREGIGNPLQYPCLENSMDRGAWCATVCKSWT